ncbi:MAG: hypothetical protein K9I85_09315 [Saprospiraceae bacterium]|nr:hypothetical protein [Saprospiraceae bacterium]
MRSFQLLLLIFILPSLTIGQSNSNLAIGTWRAALPYNTGLVVTQSPDHIYYGTSQSLLQIDKSDLSPRFFSRVENLSENGISRMAYSQRFKTLIIGYESGNIDLLDGSGVTNINDIAANTNLTGEKEIYDIYLLDDSLALLSCGFGVVQFNLKTRLFEQTAFTGFRTYQATVFQDYYYLMTDEGLYRLPLTGFFQNFSSWQHLWAIEGFPPKIFSGQGGVATLGEDLIMVVDDELYRWRDNTSELLFDGSGYTLRYLQASADRIIAGYVPDNFGSGLVYIRDLNGQEQIIEGGCAGRPKGAIIDEEDRLWMADEWLNFRRVQLPGSSCDQFQYDAPFDFSSSEIRVVQDSVYIAAGTILANQSGGSNGAGVYTLKNGTWKNYNFFGYPEMATKEAHIDINTIEVNPQDGTIYAGSYYGGLMEIHQDQITYHQKENSALQGAVGDEQRERIGGLVRDHNGNLWIANTLANNPLVLYSANKEWKSFRPIGNTQLYKGMVDNQNNKWFVLGSGGILVYNEGNDLMSASDDQVRVFDSGSSNLPSNKVTSVGLDLDGEVWIGTDDGIGVVRCGNVFDQSCKASRIVVTQEGITEALLNDEEVRAIAVDGANRKWLGTRSGLFVQSPDGLTEIKQFTESNSPLFDNQINTLAFNGRTGEMWIGTEAGIMIYQTETTSGGDVHASQVEVYPNPVRPEYQGPIAIKGLPRDGNVKITDIRGKLVYETTSLGGQAIWYGQDYTGRRAASGVYLVFTASDNAFGDPDTAVTKIVFIQ